MGNMEWDSKSVPLRPRPGQVWPDFDRFLTPPVSANFGPELTQFGLRVTESGQRSTKFAMISAELGRGGTMSTPSPLFSIVAYAFLQSCGKSLQVASCSAPRASWRGADRRDGAGVAQVGPLPRLRLPARRERPLPARRHRRSAACQEALGPRPPGGEGRRGRRPNRTLTAVGGQTLV